MATNLVKIALLVCFAVLSSGKIQILNPDKLKVTLGSKNGEIEAGMGNFGHIDYGSSIVSDILIPTKPFLFAQLGQVFVPTSNLNGCNTFTEDMFLTDAREALFSKKSGTQVPVLLL